MSVSSTWNSTPCYWLLVSTAVADLPSFLTVGVNVGKESVLSLSFCSAVCYDTPFNHLFPEEQTFDM